jgi:hypothetical protein
MFWRQMAAAGELGWHLLSGSPNQKDHLQALVDPNGGSRASLIRPIDFGLIRRDEYELHFQSDWLFCFCSCSLPLTSSKSIQESAD